jgi:hypothetical protein
MPDLEISQVLKLWDKHIKEDIIVEWEKSTMLIMNEKIGILKNF